MTMLSQNKPSGQPNNRRQISPISLSDGERYGSFQLKVQPGVKHLWASSPPMRACEGRGSFQLKVQDDYQRPYLELAHFFHHHRVLVRGVDESS